MGTKALDLVTDYNVTCPGYRFCRVLHKYQSPCKFWDCSPCWWYHDNCTDTPEPPSENCPYAICEDLPRPSSHTTTTVLSVLGGVIVVSMFLKFLYNRLRSNTEEEQEEEEDEAEPVTLLQRCRAFLQGTPSSAAAALARFRNVIAGQRANPAPPELDGERLHVFAHIGQADEDRRLEPSAPPPPPYHEVANGDTDEEEPIIRQNRRGLVNPNYGALRTRSRSASEESRREVPRMEEVPLRSAASLR